MKSNMINKFTVRYKFWIENQEGESLLGDGTWELLNLIRQEGSLMAATQKKSYSYRKTWNKIKSMEQKLGFELIDKKRGGAKGGSSELTAYAEKIILLFHLLHEKMDTFVEQVTQEALKESNFT